MVRVVARGWRRDCGANEIMSADFDEGYNEHVVGQPY